MKSKAKATKKPARKSLFEPGMSEQQMVMRAGIIWAEKTQRELNKKFDEDAFFAIVKAFAEGFSVGSLVPPVVERAKKELKK